MGVFSYLQKVLGTTCDFEEKQIKVICKPGYLTNTKGFYTLTSDYAVAYATLLICKKCGYSQDFPKKFELIELISSKEISKQKIREIKNQGFIKI